MPSAKITDEQKAERKKDGLAFHKAIVACAHAHKLSRVALYKSFGLTPSRFSYMKTGLNVTPSRWRERLQVIKERYGEVFDRSSITVDCVGGCYFIKLDADSYPSGKVDKTHPHFELCQQFFEAMGAKNEDIT
jgi:hypothetical protein